MLVVLNILKKKKVPVERRKKEGMEEGGWRLEVVENSRDICLLQAMLHVHKDVEDFIAKFWNLT